MTRMTRMFDVSQAQPQLADLLKLTIAGEEIVFTEGEKELARLLPSAQVEPAVSSKPKRVLGLHEGMGWTSDDFDEPLPDDFWLGEK